MNVDRIAGSAEPGRALRIVGEAEVAVSAEVGAEEAAALVAVEDVLEEVVPVEAGKYSVPPKLTPYMTSSDLEAIASCVHEAESRTAGEIRVHINEKLLPFQTPRKQALRVFHQLAMDQTRDRTGVLLYVTIQERRFEIVADRGVDSFVKQETWENIARNVRDRILEKGLAAGICSGVEQVGEILAAHLPRKDDDVDELANQVSFDDGKT